MLATPPVGSVQRSLSGTSRHNSPSGRCTTGAEADPGGEVGKTLAAKLKPIRNVLMVGVPYAAGVSGNACQLLSHKMVPPSLEQPATVTLIRCRSIRSSK